MKNWHELLVEQPTLCLFRWTCPQMTAAWPEHCCSAAAAARLLTCGIWWSLHMKVIAGRKLRTISWWSVRSWVLYIQIHRLWYNKRKSVYERIRQITFSEYLWFQSNGLEFSKCQILARTCATIWWKKKWGSRSRIPRKEKTEHAYIVEGVLGFRIFLPVRYLRVAGPARKIQNSSRLRQFRKWQAEIPDTPLGLTGIGNLCSQSQPIVPQFVSVTLQFFVKEPHRGILALPGSTWADLRYAVTSLHPTSPRNPRGSE